MTFSNPAAVTFRNDPAEYAFTHVVFWEQDGVAKKAEEAWCGKTLPDTMKNDLDSFTVFINTNWISCPRCIDLIRAQGRK